MPYPDDVSIRRLGAKGTQTVLMLRYRCKNAGIGHLRGRLVLEAEGWHGVVQHREIHGDGYRSTSSPLVASRRRVEAHAELALLEHANVCPRHMAGLRGWSVSDG